MDERRGTHQRRANGSISRRPQDPAGIRPIPHPLRISGPFLQERISAATKAFPWLELTVQEYPRQILPNRNAPPSAHILLLNDEAVHHFSLLPVSLEIEKMDFTSRSVDLMKGCPLDEHAPRASAPKSLFWRPKGLGREQYRREGDVQNLTHFLTSHVNIRRGSL